MAEAPPALTVTRPWGWAIIFGGKSVENRTWATRYRGPLFIHQGKGHDKDAKHFAPLRSAIDASPGDRLDRLGAAGSVLGWVNLVGCHMSESGCCTSAWAMPDQWHWELADPKQLRGLVLATGHLGLWYPDSSLLSAIREAA